MGTWGNKSFENDWAADLRGNVIDGDLGLVERALDKVMNSPQAKKLDSADCEEAIAACEFVAIANSKSYVGEEESTITFVKESLVPFLNDRLLDIKEKAVAVLDRIVANSELKDLWQESDEYQRWLDNLIALRDRLN
jgi:hypothetical protein